MAVCEICGNDYDKAFTVTLYNGDEHTFDSFECAIYAVAPRCHHCGVPIAGHGLERGGLFFCCDHCQRKAEEAPGQDPGGA